MNTENYKINNEALKYFRVEKAYSQEDLAQKCKVGTNTVSRWETGTSNPKLDSQEILTKVLGITLDQLKEQPPIKERPDARIKSTISDSANAALDIVSETYHINKDAIIDFAPLMFHALAAASLGARVIKLDQMDKAIEEFQQYSVELLPYLPSGVSIEQVMDGGNLFEEHEAISNNHLFFSGEITDDIHDISTNPFSQFIKPFIDSMPEKLNTIFDIEWRNNELPKYHINDAFIKELIVVPIDDDLFVKIKELIFNGKMKLKEVNVRDCGLNAEGIEEYRDKISNDIKKDITEKFAAYKSSKKMSLGEGK